MVQRQIAVIGLGLAGNKYYGDVIMLRFHFIKENESVASGHMDVELT